MKRAALILLLLVAGCAKPPATGTVTRLDFTPSHYDDYTTYNCVWYSKSGFCKVEVPYHHHDFVGDQWRLTYKGKNSDGDMDDNTVDISQQQYNNCHFDDYWDGAHCTLR